jgi:ribonuclease Z
MTIQILGSGSGGPFQGRNFTAQLLRVEGEVYLIDCGEGTQHQLYRFRARYEKVKQLFISHLHGDHVFGLMGLITSFCLKNRTETLTLYGPPGLRQLVEINSTLCGVRYPYPLEVIEVDPELHQKVFESPLVEVYTLPLEHRTPCTGWLFREKPRQPNMRAEKISEYQMDYPSIRAVKAGSDLVLPDGRVIPNQELVLAPPPPASYAFCSDTAPSERVVRWLEGVHTLYHEATFTNEHLEEAAISGHSTAAQAAEIAREAGVGQLLMGHFSARYKDVSVHLEESRAVFAASYAVEEGMVYEIRKER